MIYDYDEDDYFCLGCDKKQLEIPEDTQSNDWMSLIEDEGSGHWLTRLITDRFEVFESRQNEKFARLENKVDQVHKQATLTNSRVNELETQARIKKAVEDDRSKRETLEIETADKQQHKWYKKQELLLTFGGLLTIVLGNIGAIGIAAHFW